MLNLFRLCVWVCVFGFFGQMQLSNKFSRSFWPMVPVSTTDRAVVKRVERRGSARSLGNLIMDYLAIAKQERVVEVWG